MLEIDGEFFEDPVETLKKEKNIAILKVACEIPRIIVNTLDQPEVQEALLEMAKVQMKMIMVQPIFPTKFATGGMVNPSTRFENGYLKTEKIGHTLELGNEI